MPTPSLSRAVIVLVALLGAAGCSKETISPPYAATLGGGEVWIYTPNGPSSCPSDHPQRRVAGDAVVCGAPGVDFAAVTRFECAEASLDCDALYGCTAKKLSLCDATTTTADCGGDGPAVFACRSVSGCIWFTHGCLANGFEASLCPIDDVCCASADGGGLTAYPDSVALAGSASDFIDDYGTGFIGLDDGFTLDVVEADPSGFTGPAITCPAPDAHPFLCGSTTWVLVANAAQTQPWFVGRQDLGSYGFTIDRRTLQNGMTKARVCMYSHADAPSATCPLTPPSEPHCATSGTLTIGTSSARAEFVYGSATWVVDFLP